MNAVVTSLQMMAGGAFWTIILALMLRSDRYMRKTVESALKWRRQPVTPGAIEYAMPGAKAALIMGIVVTGGTTVLGAITLVIRVATVMTGL